MTKIRKLLRMNPVLEDIVVYHDLKDNLITLRYMDGSEIKSNIKIIDGKAQLVPLFTETETELLLLAMIDIKELWEKSKPGQMDPKQHVEITEHYDSMIDKLKTTLVWEK